MPDLYLIERLYSNYGVTNFDAKLGIDRLRGIDPSLGS